MTVQRILIAGCGDLGTELGSNLAEQGHTVFGLRRNPPSGSGPIQWLRADLTVAETLADLPGNLDLVFYLATPGAYEDEAYRKAYVRGVGQPSRPALGNTAAAGRVRVEYRRLWPGRRQLGGRIQPDPSGGILGPAGPGG